MDRRLETRILQGIVAICSLVPIMAGMAGVIWSARVFGNPNSVSADFDAHFRYLSGLLLAIGIAYLVSVPNIKNRRGRFLLLGSIVFVGGLGRLTAVLLDGIPSKVVVFALIMELCVTPLITLWQRRISDG